MPCNIGPKVAEAISAITVTHVSKMNFFWHFFGFIDGAPLNVKCIDNVGCQGLPVIRCQGILAGASIVYTCSEKATAFLHPTLLRKMGLKLLGLVVPN